MRQMLLLLLEVPIVWFFMAKLRARALSEMHPWCTGKIGDSNTTIWAQNIVYCSPQRSTGTAALVDAEIANATGQFLARMVQRSCAAQEIPHGPKRRMSHAVNYIHGAVHYNGVFLIFDDCLDLVRHLSDPQFRRELRRFAKTEAREFTFLLRERAYAPLDFAYCIGAVRNYLPWFSNGNGPTKKPVLWGNMAPFPAVNLINGAWVADLWKVLKQQNASKTQSGRSARTSLVRAPVDAKRYFQASYAGAQTHYRRADQLQAWFMYTDVRLRGFRGQLFFADRAIIEPHRRAEYLAAGGYGRWVACHPVPFPRALAALPVPQKNAATPKSVSVIIPMRNEAAHIARSLHSVRAALPNAEIIVVDANSSDASVAVAQGCGVRTIIAGADQIGRGRQCNLGAQAASGELLVFLHADCILAGNAEGALQRTFADLATQTAKFSVRFEHPALRYRWMERICRKDSLLSSFGDQGMAVRTRFFQTHALMPDFALFEDVEFFRRSRKHTRLARIPCTLSTSTRRFEQYGFVRTHAINTVLIGMYLCGVAPTRLHRLYYRLSRRQDL